MVTLWRSSSLSKKREKVFSLHSKDFKWETFRSGGKGGQNQNARSTGVRVHHLPSGAVGESREHRTQLQNKRAAFRRMGESDLLITWCRVTALKLRPIDEIVDEAMKEENLKIEYL